MSNFEEWAEQKDFGLDYPIVESTASNRYSIEVNYRSSFDEVVENFAKLVLGYVSAAMKNCGYHVKVVFNNNPLRTLVSTRNWDDGEWVGIVTFNPHENCFILAKGSYNKDRKSISVHSSRKCTSKSAAEIVKDLRNDMEKLKKDKPVGSNTLQPAQLKRGPKPTHMTKLKNMKGPWEKTI